MKKYLNPNYESNPKLSLYSIVSIHFQVNNTIFFFNFQSSLNGHKNIVGFIDSNIIRHNNGVHEVLMLMPYCPSNVLTLMNNR